MIKSIENLVSFDKYKNIFGIVPLPYGMRSAALYVLIYGDNIAFIRIILKRF